CALAAFTSFPTRRPSDLASFRMPVQFPEIMQGSASAPIVLAVQKLRDHVNIRIRQYLLRAVIIFVVIAVNSVKLVAGAVMRVDRSEEHTSELQSRENLVC